ncbi:MAG: mycofactocin precursor MftA [Sphaerobacter sp.]|nr:mycofactocin precursor MftA [Sphaerobacter sp.]
MERDRVERGERGAVATVEPEGGERPWAEREAALGVLDREDVTDEELEELLIREITIDGMCGVY